MSTLVIIGAQWGDEAKGKLVDALGGEADYVVRYSGGNNAGHTVIANGQEYKFQLIPAGILHPTTTAVLASGMVICPKGLLEELDRTTAITPNIGKLAISSAAHVVFPYHRMLDALEESARGENKIGTTSRGIGPAYQDKVARLGIRMSEFVNPTRFAARLAEVLTYKNQLLQLFGQPAINLNSLYDEFCGYADRIRPYVCETEPIVQKAVYGNKRVLFEGAQGTFLDLDSGTYPYVTSSHPISGGACLGTGIGPRDIGNVMGVVKAYTTRVGGGPFPTELHDEIGEGIRQVGREYGTVTGRIRRVGWLDLVVLGHSCKLNSLSSIALTRLDVLTNIPKIKIATKYSVGGETIDYLPTDIEEFGKACPHYVELDGWEGDLRKARKLSDLPENARKYVQFVEDSLKVPISIVSIGPDRQETIVARPELIWG